MAANDKLEAATFHDAVKYVTAHEGGTVQVNAAQTSEVLRKFIDFMANLAPSEQLAFLERYTSDTD